MNVYGRSDYISRINKKKTIDQNRIQEKDCEFRKKSNLIEKSTKVANWSTFANTIVMLITLIAVVVGFNAFDKNSKKLEDIYLYKELKVFYSELGLHETLSAHKEQFKDSFMDYYYAYNAALELNLGSDIRISDTKRDIFSREDFVLYVHQIWEFLIKIYHLHQYMESMNMMEAKYTPIFYYDILDIMGYIRGMKDMLRFERIQKATGNEIHVYNSDELVKSFELIYKLIEPRVRSEIKHSQWAPLHTFDEKEINENINRWEGLGK